MQVQSVLSTKQASVIGAENAGSIPVTCISWLDARVVDAASLLRKSSFGYRWFESPALTASVIGCFLATFFVNIQLWKISVKKFLVNNNISFVSVYGDEEGYDVLVKTVKELLKK